MSAYELIEQHLDVAGRRWCLRTLKDRQQFHDPNGAFEAAGISPAAWPLFGVVWPAGIMLAEYMAGYPVAGLRILEAGCGLALPSMVLQARGADITASDIHPLAGEFLAENAARNGLPPVPFELVDWSLPDGDAFDLLIGSDLLYERAQPELLARLVDARLAATGTMILADPGRGQVARFNRLMAARGFAAEETFEGKARLVRYEPSTLSHQGARSTT